MRGERDNLPPWAKCVKMCLACWVVSIGEKMAAINTRNL